MKERARVFVGVVGLNVERAVGDAAHGSQLVGEVGEDAAGAGGIAGRVQGRDGLRGGKRGDPVRVMIGQSVHGGAAINFHLLTEFVVEPQAATPTRGHEALVDKSRLISVSRTRRTIRQGLMRLVKRVLGCEECPVAEVERDRQFVFEDLGVGNGVVVREAGHAIVERPVGEAKRAAEKATLGVEAGFRNHVHGAAD